MSSEPADPHRSRLDRLERRCIALVVLCASIVLLIRAAPGTRGDGVDHAVFDMWMRSSANAEVDTSEVAVILVDDAGLAELGERWPLRRRTWASFLEVLTTYEPAAVAVDAWFESPEPSVEVDLALDISDKLRITGLADDGIGLRLAESLDQTALDLDGDRGMAAAVGALGRVILGAACVSGTKPGVPGLHLVQGTEPLGMRCEALSGNHTGLSSAARGQAVLDLMHSRDGRVRRYPYAVQVDDQRVASLALAAVALGRPDALDTVQDRALGLDGGTPLLRTIHPRQFTTVAFSDLLVAGPGEASLSERLKGRVVFVGVSAQGTEDVVYGPLGYGVPGVFFHANGAIDLLHSRHVISDGIAAALGATAGGLLLLVLAAGGRRWANAPVVLAGAGGAALTWLALAAVAIGQGVLIPVIPVLAPIASWAGVRLLFSWLRETAAKRAAQAQREVAMTQLEVRNEELRESLDTLRRTKDAKARMESELAVAREIQMSMLPEPELLAQIQGLDAWAKLEPALEVGGDLYDCFELDADRVCFCVGDVSGKGVPAALFMAVSKALLVARAMDSFRPSQIVAAVNDQLAADNDAAMFVTLFLGVLERSTGRVTYTNAGHNPPYLWDGSSWVCLDARHGPVVGAMEELPFGEDEFVLPVNGQLIVFTDGVTEAMDPDGELYEEERLLEVLGAGAAPDARSLVDSVFAGVHAFENGVGQADDITVLVLSRPAS